MLWSSNGRTMFLFNKNGSICTLKIFVVTSLLIFLSFSSSSSFLGGCIFLFIYFEFWCDYSWKWFSGFYTLHIFLTTLWKAKIYIQYTGWDIVLLHLDKKLDLRIPLFVIENKKCSLSHQRILSLPRKVNPTSS